MKRFLSVSALCLAVLGVGSVAYASIPDGSGVIHGCRNNLTRIVTVIDDSTQNCLLGTTPLNWNQTGPEGLQGPSGPPGAAGPAGPGSSFYRVLGSFPVPIGSTSASGKVECEFVQDVMVGGGYSFDINVPFEAGAIYPPQHVSAHVDRPVNHQFLRQSYEVAVDYDAYAPASDYGTVLKIYGVCARPTS